MEDIKKENMKKAFKEVNEILKCIPEYEKNKINDKFLRFLEENEEKEYDFKIDNNNDFNEDDYLAETKLLLVKIYMDYWCTEEEKNKIEKIIIENEKKEQEKNYQKYNVDNIFKKENTKKQQMEVAEKDLISNELIIIEENEGIFKKIINLLKKWFNKNKK